MHTTQHANSFGLLSTSNLKIDVSIEISNMLQNSAPKMLDCDALAYLLACDCCCCLLFVATIAWPKVSAKLQTQLGGLFELQHRQPGPRR